jgi:signal transduction histidine kinase
MINDRINTSCTDEPSEESVSHLKEVNKKLITKYNNQREFVSLAAHELRSPILPILGTLDAEDAFILAVVLLPCLPTLPLTTLYLTGNKVSKLSVFCLQITLR